MISQPRGKRRAFAFVLAFYWERFPHQKAMDTSSLETFETHGRLEASPELFGVISRFGIFPNKFQAFPGA